MNVCKYQKTKIIMIINTINYNKHKYKMAYMYTRIGQKIKTNTFLQRTLLMVAWTKSDLHLFVHVLFLPKHDKLVSSFRLKATAIFSPEVSRSTF